MKFSSSFKYRFLGVMILIFAMVSTVGFLTYKEFVKVLGNAKEYGKSDPIVNSTKNLIFSLTQAENRVKTYTLTQDSLFLAQYVEFTEEIEVQLEQLELDKKRTKLNDVPIDTLQDLVHRKLAVYDSLLILQNEFRVQQALEKVTESIEDISEVVPSEVESKFLFFKRKKKSNTETEVHVDYNEIKSNLLEIRSSETSREEEQLRREFSLLEEDKFYTSQIQRILTQLENQSLIHDKQRATETTKIVSDANVQVLIFCVIISILLIISSAAIIRYITKSTHYRKILKEAKNEAESLSAAKEHFVATVSHEIRTPMNIISGFSEQLSNSELNEQQRDQLQTVIKASTHLLKLINEVLDFTKLQNYKLRLETYDFVTEDILTEVRDLMTPLAESKGIEFELEIQGALPEALVGDPIRLSQILINVTSNAIKFTDKGFVTLKVTSEDRQDGNALLKFAIIDTGIGMSQDKVSRVFEAFEQADLSTTRTYGGTGLGLSITKKLIDLHKGNVHVISEEGKGTEVHIDIPYKLGSTENIQISKPSQVEHVNLSTIQILIADDEVFNRKLITTILKKYGANLKEVENGQEAVSVCSNEKFDLILMDARMPILDGVSASKEIKSKGANQDTPIVALSAAVRDEDLQEYKSAGIEGFVAKPFKESTLIQKIITLLSIEAESTSSTNVNSSKENQLDFSEMKALSGGDRNFYAEMLNTFINGTKDGIEQMKLLAKENKISEISNVAHKISSPCKHFEANNLYNLFKQIESEGEQNESNLNRMITLIDKVEKESSYVIKQIQVELNTLIENN